MEERAPGRGPHADGEEEEEEDEGARGGQGGRGQGGEGALCKINPRALLARNRGST